jgi:hypothetical protein
MKDTYYFSHDYNSRNDHKIKRLISKHGYLGYGLFWAIIEDLYNNANALQTDYESIAFDLRTSENIIESIINDFDLFIIEGDNFGSLSAQRRLEERDAKSQKARETAFKRWNKNKENANAMQTHSKGNAIKESKENKKESKEYNYGANNNIILSVAEYEKLISDYGELKTLKAIDYLSDWGLEKPTKFKEYKNHNLTLRRWVFEAIEKKPVFIDPKKLEADKYIEDRKQAILRGTYEQKDLEIWIKNNYKW